MSQLYKCATFCKVLAVRSIQAARKAYTSTLVASRRNFIAAPRSGLFSTAQQCKLRWPDTTTVQAPLFSFHSVISTTRVNQTRNNSQDPLSTGDRVTAHNNNRQTVVYVGTLARMVCFVKFFSLSSSLIGLSVLPYIYKNIAQLPVALAAVISSFMGFFIMVTPLVLHLVTKRYVTSITLDQASGRFTAETYSFFLIKKRLEFTADQAKVPALPGLFTTLVINGKVPLFVDPSLFVDRNALLQLMKYDEPLEWELESEENSSVVAKDKRKMDS